MGIVCNIPPGKFSSTKQQRIAPRCSKYDPTYAFVNLSFVISDEARDTSDFVAFRRRISHGVYPERAEGFEMTDACAHEPLRDEKKLNA